MASSRVACPRLKKIGNVCMISQPGLQTDNGTHCPAQSSGLRAGQSPKVGGKLPYVIGSLVEVWEEGSEGALSCFRELILGSRGLILGPSDLVWG